MGVIQSNNTKGNKFHDSETGEFISEDGISNAKQEVDNDVGVFVLQNKPRLNISMQGINDFLNSKKEEKNKVAENFINNNKKYFDENMQQYYENLTKEEKLILLKESPNGYNPLFLKFATDKEINALLYAEGIVNRGKQLTQDFLLLEKEKENINNSIANETNLFLIAKKYPQVHGVWYYDVGVSEYEDKIKKDDNGLSSIDKKKQYYNDILNDPNANLSKKASAFANLKKLDNFSKSGEEFLEFKNQIKLKYLDELQNIETKIVENKSQQNLFNTNSAIILEANKYIEKFQDINSIYSQARKNKATWINENWLKEHGYHHDSVHEVALNYFGPKFEKMWVNMSSAEQDRLIDYTGNGYSKYNKPLRGLEHTGWTDWNFADNVTTLTNAIDKCVWDEDIWVQRGIGDSKIFKLPDSDILTTLGDLTNGQLQSLVGTSFKDNGFVSCGAGKGTGFVSSYPIIFNIYCPKGTKMAYMNTKGAWKKSSENEMLIQRGYDYRITKIEKSGKYYIDCEVIFNSDQGKITDKNKLQEIGNKYLI